MASVRVTLGISSADVLSTALGLNVATTLVADSGTMIRAKVAATSGAGSGITVYKADDKDTSAYVYVSNLATEHEDYIAGGQFAFIPVAVDKTFKAYGTKVNQTIEYGVFGYDNPANTLG
jgi:hypothetical protein